MESAAEGGDGACAFAVTAARVHDAPAALVLSGGRYGFDDADGVASDGSVVRTLSAGRYDFRGPPASLASAGSAAYLPV